MWKKKISAWTRHVIFFRPVAEILFTFWMNSIFLYNGCCSIPTGSSFLSWFTTNDVLLTALFNAQFSGTVTQSRMLRWQQGLRGKESYRRRQLEQLASPTLPNRNFKNKKTWKNLEKRDVMLFVKSLEEVANHFLPEQSSLLRTSTFFGSN